MASRKVQKNTTDYKVNRAKKKRKGKRGKRRNKKRLDKRQGSKQTNKKKRAYGQSTTQVADTNVNR